MAKQMIDIGLDSLEDLTFVGGDFAMPESTSRHQQELILNNYGDFKQNPTICVGAFDYMDDEHFQNLIRAISIAFSKDGMDVKSLALSSSGVINSDAYYP